MRGLIWRTAPLAAALVFAGLIMSHARADALYSVTNLGPASPSAAYLSGENPIDPSGNYLGALSTRQLAAFEAGSFDVFAHPATGYYTSAINPDYSQLSGAPLADSFSMLTGNNVGQYVGDGLVSYYAGASSQLILYTPGPPFPHISVWLDDSALANLLFRLWHEPAGCWLKWSGQPG
jgi:hypothetical protein